MPLPDGVSSPPPAASPKGRSPSFFPSRRGLWWILLLGIVGPCAAVNAPREIGRWQVAQAVSLRERGDKEAAYDKMTAAMWWFPNSPELLILRAEWRLQDGERTEALADADRAVELAHESVGALRLRGQLLLEAREFPRAIEDFKTVAQQSRASGRPPLAESLNTLAYTQALAKVELPDALARVNEALELSPGDVQYLDTRGFIYHLLGDNVPALDDLNKAVEGIDQQLAEMQAATAAEKPAAATKSAKTTKDAKDTKAEAEDAKAEAVVEKEAEVEKSDKPAPTPPNTIFSPFTSSGNSDDRKLASIKQAAAVIHYHRALALRALDQPTAADDDLATARRLCGREPDETLF